jgi:hypothetical protein
MGRKVDLDSPLSAEDKEYLISRGRGYLIPANERRFGVDGNATPAPGEEAGQPSVNSFYDSDVRDKAVYDVGGAPLPGTVLDKDTGRVYDRDNGVIVEPVGMGLHHSGSDLSAQRDPDYGRSDDGDDIDEDIAEFVLARSQTKDKLKARLDEEGVEYSSDDDKAKLQERLAVALQDKRDAGEEINLSES